ncbi:MAG TPA: hypothetical protein VMT69_14770 [Kineosporiaceae bacterium]|nr:hypothetical protein [Kineosporiaceae bacterium]
MAAVGQFELALSIARRTRARRADAGAAAEAAGAISTLGVRSSPDDTVRA